MRGDMIVLVVVSAFVVIGCGIGCVIYLYFFRLWFRTHVAQCSLPLMTIFRLFFRKTSPQIIVNSYIDLHKAGMMVSVEELEAHFKDGGNVRLVAQAMVAAKRLGNEVGFESARMIDLTGKNVMQEIGMEA
jgi:uncharacterized protein YqfA (UPF0365 family)